MANDKKFIAKNGIQGLDASVFTSITTSGKVGVGTASPVAGLDVLGTSGYTGTIHNHLYANGEGVRIFGNEATLDLLGQDNGDHASSVYFRNGTEGFAWINDPDSDSFQLRSFTSTGNDFNAHGTGSAISNLVSILDIGKTGDVGIGTDAPGEKLDVNGDVRVRGSGSTMAGTTVANASLLVGSSSLGIGIDDNEIVSSGSSLYLGPVSGFATIFREGQIEYMRVDNGGNVGIGTANPSAKLQITPPNEHQDSFRIYRGGSSGYELNYLNMSLYQGNTVFNTTSSDSSGKRYLFQINGTEKVRIDQNGEVGIGTNDPKKQLHVLGGTGDLNSTTIRLGAAVNTDTNHTPKIELAETADTSSNMHYGFSITGDGASTNNLLFRSHNNSTGGTIALSIDRDSANVGIGTNDAGDDKLYVTGGRSRFEVQNVPNGVISSNASAVIEATEAQMQILGVDTGSWASNIVLTNAPASGNNKHWTMHHTPASHPTIANALQFRYLATNTVGNIGGDGTGALTETKMTIANSGNVGIGSAAPGSLLTVYNSATAGNTRLHVHNDKNGDAAELRLEGKRTSNNDTGQLLYVNSGNVVARISANSGADDGDLRFYTSLAGTGQNVTERLRIEAGGDLLKSGGVIKGERGTAAAPAYTFSDDTDTGMFNISNADLGFSVGGTERMRILGSGNVGIGTVTPYGILHTHDDNTRMIMGAINSNLSAQHRIEFWETPATASTTAANYAIEYDGTTTYGGDGAFLFRGYGTAENQVLGGINRLGTAFFGMAGGSPNLGIGTTSPTNKLDIRGNVSQIDGSPEYHFATSSATHYNWRVAVQEAVDAGFEIASGQQTAGTSANSDTYTNRLVIKADGNVGIGTNAPTSLLNLYKAEASPVLLTLHNYQSDINGGGFTQGSFIDFKMTDDNATFTPQVRIGMVIGDSDGGDAGIPSEGSGNFQIYTGNGTDATGGGNLDLHSRFGQNGRLKIFTPGNTTDGTYYSTLTINNTGSSTWSRIRFDRSGVARWGLSLGTDDKFKISNLYTNGSTATPDDTCLVIDNNSDVGLGTASPAAKLHVYGTAHFQSDSGIKILSATNNPSMGAVIYFSDNIPAQGQNGHIRYKHSDSSVVAGSNEQMVFGGDQPVSDFLFEGDVFSSGDVTAYYSDPRLKDFHGTITGALDKVNSLSGYYFTENDKAKELGYRNERMQVGVNAEEVAAVLPEVVTIALINEKIPEDETRDYKTVKYEKMVPLLIEAIKELTEQNMEMKQRLDKLEGEA